MDWIMSQIKSYPEFARTQIQSNGVRGMKNSITVPTKVLVKALSWQIDNRVQIGTPVWDRKWDILIVLDACRFDLMKEVCDEYDFLPSENDLESFWSIASMSEDWICRTFSKEYGEKVGETAYITGNCFTSKVNFEVEPQILDEVWTYAWDDELSTIPARPITDQSISVWRNRNANITKMVVHYMQPHVPFVKDPEIGDYGEPKDFGNGFADIWDRVGNELDYDVVWEAYVDNLRYVLNEVSILLNNVDGKVVITSDHGNAIGEWGFYSHPSGLLTPQIRKVPWVESESSDLHTHSPKEYDQKSIEQNVDDRLKALGYK